MDPLKIFWAVYGVVLILGTIGRILMIGKPREPVTPADAAASLIVSAIMFVFVLATWTRL